MFDLLDEWIGVGVMFLSLMVKVGFIFCVLGWMYMYLLEYVLDNLWCNVDEMFDLL